MTIRTASLVLAVSLAAACTTSGESQPESVRARTSEVAPTRAAAAPAIHWETWSDELFERARREQRFVLLDLEAVWCHWCHVMEETTYADPSVVQLVNEHYIAVKVDQDSRPDLSNRYEDYGWPATIVFDARGGEIITRSGYIPPAEFAATLAAIVADPTPGPSVARKRAVVYASASAIDEDVRRDLDSALDRAYDRKLGGFGSVHKYVDLACIEYCIARGLEGDAERERMARATLDAGLALVDPVWGGVYQYSAGGVWTQAHFEKIMSMQADVLRAYALAFAAYGDARYARAAQDIHRYLREFLLGPDGAFFTSQDADLVPGEHSSEYFALSDAERRRRGVPRVDTHVYARENGWAARALLALYSATGDESALAEARRALARVTTLRSLADGGFRHDANDAAGPYLGDTLAMAQAFLALYEATGDRGALASAMNASRFIAASFVDENASAGVATVRVARDASLALAAQPPEREENVAVARLENALFRYTGDKSHRELAERAMRFVATREVALRGLTAGPLLADLELESEPMHVTIVGAKSDARAASLMRAALASPAIYRRIEWWDPKEGALPNADVEFPVLDAPAAFACAGGRCSSPAFTPEDVKKRIAALGR